MLRRLFRCRIHECLRLPKVVLLVVMVCVVLAVLVARWGANMDVVVMNVKEDDKLGVGTGWSNLGNLKRSFESQIQEENNTHTTKTNMNPPPLKPPEFSSPIRFEPFHYNPAVEDPDFDTALEFPCSQPDGPGEDGIEDLMCIPRKELLPQYKNPCYYDTPGQLKCLPYFHLLGYDKCGTTDFYARLVLHPSILQSWSFKGKEVYFWCWRRYGIFMKHSSEVMTYEQYVYTFRNVSKYNTEHKSNASSPQAIIGDGGPIDLWDFRGWPRDPQNRGLLEPKVLTPHHVRHIIQHPRFFVMVRDPVERMFSDYLFMGDGFTAEEFDRDVPIAIQMMEDCLKVNTTRQCFYSQHLYMTMPMRLHISCYSIFLREWLAVFPKKYFFFLRSEDYHKDMKGSLREAFKFLEIDTLTDSALEEITKHVDEQNKTMRKGSAGTMSDKTRKMLEDFYAPCTQDLRDLLDDDKYLC